MEPFAQTPQQMFDTIQERMLQACDRSNRELSEITLIGVSKGHSFEHIRPYLDLPLGHLGENYLQEAEQKLPLLKQSKTSLQSHFIGHLQTNKVKKTLELFDYIHSVDSIKLASELEKRCNQLLSSNPSKFNKYPVFVEVNLSDDANKTGCTEEQVVPLLEYIEDESNHLDALGLMVISPLEMVKENDLHQFFKNANNFLQKVQESFPSCIKLSMGMSNDFEIAIEEGSTHVRIGTLLFGPRT